MNEEEISERLEKHGFRIVRLEEHPVAEQAAMFDSAQAVCALHGAGLTNLAFCRPGTRVLELFSPLYGTHAFHMIALRLGLDYCCVNGRDEEYESGKATPVPTDNSKYILRDAWVDPDLVERWAAALPDAV